MKKIINKIIDFSLLYRVLRLASPHKRKFYIAIFIAIAMAGLSILNPYLIQITLDKYILKGNYEMLVTMSAVMLGSLLVQAFLSYNFTLLTARLGQNVIQSLRVKVFAHLLHMNVRFFDKTPVGISTTRTVNDVETINDIFSEGIITILSDLLTIIVVLIFMFSMSWKLTLVAMSILPLLILSAWVFKEGIKKSFTEVRNQVARLNTFVQEHLTGMSVVQLFTAEKREMEKFKVINREHRDAHISSNWYYSIFFPMVEIISALAISLLVWYWSGKYLQNDVTVGMLNSFIMCINLLFRPIRMLADKFNTLQMGMVAAERVFKLIDSEDRIQNTGKISTGKLKGEIVFENVWFAYDDDFYVLKDVSFKVKAGESLAIVGATGSGKSTMINLLMRFYEVQKGRITIDGIDIRDYDVYTLRKNMGLVLQDVFLFSGSVLDNIRLRNESILKTDIIKASKLCGVDEFVEQLPNGYDFEVKERGATLSMGQRQLISFVRALVHDPAILILDEATSSIDTESEQIIQRAIVKMVSNRTSIIIAHRLSTIQNSNCILVLDHAEVKECGTHEELIAQDGFYKKLYDMQFKKERIEVL